MSIKGVKATKVETPYLSGYGVFLCARLEKTRKFKTLIDCLCTFRHGDGTIQSSALLSKFVQGFAIFLANDNRRPTELLERLHNENLQAAAIIDVARDESGSDGSNRRFGIMRVLNGILS